MRHLYLHSFPTRRSSDLLFFLLGAEVRGDGGDVELVDSHLLLAGLRSPIGRRVAEQRSLRVIGGHANRDVIEQEVDRKSTRLNSSHRCISYAVFCLKKKK